MSPSFVRVLFIPISPHPYTHTHTHTHTHRVQDQSGLPSFDDDLPLSFISSPRVCWFIQSLERKLSVFQYAFLNVLGGSAGNNLPANAGDVDLIPGSGRSSAERNDNPLQYSCLGSPMDRGPWWAPVHRVGKESDTVEELNNNNAYYLAENGSHFFTLLDPASD